MRRLLRWLWRVPVEQEVEDAIAFLGSWQRRHSDS